MADEPLALSTIPPAIPSDSDYDAFCTTLRRTERGRWFLAEHARRSRHAGAIPVNPGVHGEDAQQTPNDISAAIERLQDLSWTMREHGLDAATCENIEMLASTISSASPLGDRRRAQQLREALGHLERHIDSMIVAAKERAREQTRKDHDPAPFEAMVAPLDGAPVPACPEDVGEAPVQSMSLETPPELPTPVTMEVTSTPSHAAAREIASEAAIVRVPTMWEPTEAKTSATPPRRDDWTADIEEELFAGPALPVPKATDPTPPTGLAGPGLITPSRNDPLAALNALSDVEKIALFT